MTFTQTPPLESLCESMVPPSAFKGVATNQDVVAIQRQLQQGLQQHAIELFHFDQHCRQQAGDTNSTPLPSPAATSGVNAEMLDKNSTVQSLIAAVRSQLRQDAEAVVQNFLKVNLPELVALSILGRLQRFSGGAWRCEYCAPNGTFTRCDLLPIATNKSSYRAEQFRKQLIPYLPAALRPLVKIYDATVLQQLDANQQLVAGPSEVSVAVFDDYVLATCPSISDCQVVDAKEVSSRSSDLLEALQGNRQLITTVLVMIVGFLVMLLTAFGHDAIARWTASLGGVSVLGTILWLLRQPSVLGGAP